MKVLFSWLKDYIDGQIELEKLTDSLTMAGLEVGAVEDFHGDKVIDIEITPNRADCLSLIGIAREIKALFGLRLKKPSFKIQNEKAEPDFKIFIINQALCYRYAGRIIKNVKVGPSPDWLKKRLEASGLRSINNVVDVTNYVLLEWGHPLHAFDLDLLEGKQIRVGTPKDFGMDSVEITTLDGVKRQLCSDDLLIWDGVKPVAIAGIMGGANTEVTDKTTNVLLESAYFKPERIRKTSKRLGLSTEASYRFERGTDIEALKQALDRAAFLIQQIAGGEIYEPIDIYPVKVPLKEVVFTPEKIRLFLGATITDEEILKILELLEIDVTKKDSGYIAKIPSHRQDISIEEDIAEEVARIYGYDKIPAQLPRAFRYVEQNHELAQKRKFLNLIRDYMISLGYSEAINFSFMSAEDLDLFEIPENDARRQFISLLNPLRQEESIIRTMLLPNLLKNVEKNTARGIENLKLFEIGRVFIAKAGKSLPEETVHLGIIAKKEDFKTPFKDDPYDFYALKGVIDGFFRHFKIKNVFYVRSKEPFLHAGQSADIILNGEKIGFVGVISPKLISKLNFKTKPFICMTEIDLDRIFLSVQNEIKYKPFSTFPPVKRDVALILPVDFESQKLLDIINSSGNEFIEDVYIFDVYQGKGIPEGQKSIAFRITYRALDRTLTTEEVESFHKRLIEKLIAETGASLRT
ncbi:phenylalanyl-tRNA synthetase beta chain [Thermodesulfovibrio aggregans]|uniref:Phenylalanine--tRNA ligase beta subunit n=1 Tax=Thermodesulfovibrio aggregans TaxID=86166 RepID=A0A0U9HS20_9BACT|nr:phenylalanine--tRNA ligase subunit beta [Thermodesulfovibrio aggregans]GAQ95803.1 phenylalanyl-tRNA synthetase beta chain [Thermodesulfovibrio aggregans]